MSGSGLLRLPRLTRVPSMSRLPWLRRAVLPAIFRSIFPSVLHSVLRWSTPQAAQLVALAVVLSGALMLATPARAEVSAIDDSGHLIVLRKPATRIVSLAPHTTELLFAAGAGARVVGVSAYSDYPAEARQRPSIGDAMRVDLERIIALKPDLIIGWRSGNHAAQLARLRALGFAVFDSEPRRLDDIASTLERLGTLSGSAQGSSAAANFRTALQALRERYAKRAPVTVFYQIWASPLMTLNDTHIVSEAIRLCGGINLFGKLVPLVPAVSREAVLKANPQAIFVSDEDPQGVDRWRTFGRLDAVRNHRLYRVDGSVMNRAGPRMADATARLCEQIDNARPNDSKNLRRMK